MMKRLMSIALVLFAAGSIAACNGTSTNGKSAFQTDLGTVGGDQQSVAAEAAAVLISGNYTALGGDCHQLLADVGKLQGDTPPSSYTSAMQSELIKMNSDNAQGADECIQAVNNDDHTSLVNAIGLFTSVAALESQLTNQVVDPSGSPSSGISQSTSTTLPPTTTTSTTPLSSVDQKFVGDVETQFPSLPNAISGDPGFTTKTLAAEGEAVCNAFSKATQQDITDAYQFYIASEFLNGNLPGSGGAIPSLKNSEVRVVLGIAVEDICPIYSADIPPGEPGAP